MAFSAGINNAYMVRATRENALQKFKEIIKVKIFFTMLVLFLSSFLLLLKLEISVWGGAIIIGVILSPFETICLKYQTVGDIGKYAAMLPVKNFLYYGAALFSFVFMGWEPSAFLVILSKLMLGPSLILCAIWWMRAGGDLKIKVWLRRSKNYFFQDAAALVIMRLDAWVVAFLAGITLLTQRDVGLYSACLTFATPLAVLTSSLSAVLLPKNANGLDIKWSKTLKTMLGVAICGVVAVWLCIYIYITFFSTESDYLSVRWLSIPMLLATVFSLCAMVLRVKCFHDNKERLVTFVTLAQVPIIIISYSFLGYAVGVWGCVASFMLVRMISMVWLFFIDRRTPKEIVS
ncbi:lipopolysaccharide biosynthesis protein [Alloalcanivorax xenomutans]|uniref:Polysaccharide biosynthesis protein n=1 Tax=Alloalcanivorax xenomutans TaxID=1094342 RepID=A0A9Q3W400_9GAMM|nr:hypothetical protein [Alloalcanivorax xenomutans]MCE7507668.1 hypothetical protein [Alloalcanivorax xenomutans]